MPAEVFTPNQLEKYEMKTLITVLVLFIVAITTFSWLFARVIFPLIARLRNNLLI
jgi:polyferredoxin